MRCHEAKKRIEAGDLDDAALIEHLRNCATCAKLAEVERQLACSFRQAASASSPAATPFPLLRQRIELAAAGTQRKERNIMSEISQQIRIHPRLSVGMAMAVLVFMFATLVPFSYERISGYDATIAFAGVTEGIPQEKIEKALEAIGQSHVEVSAESAGENTSYRLKGFKSESEALQAVFALETQTGAKGQSKIRPTLNKVFSSIYKRLIDEVKSVKVMNTEGKTDQELEQDIATKLLAAGLLNPKVKVATDANGVRTAIAECDLPSEHGKDYMAVKISWQMDDDGATTLTIRTSDSTAIGMKAAKWSPTKDSTKEPGNIIDSKKTGENK